jgi:site-specific recombinase XerD
MYFEVANFNQWLRCQYPQSITAVHYTSDVRLFFSWANKPPAHITIRDIDAYIAHCREQGHAVNTINRRLAALRAFYYFLQRITNTPQPPNPVIPRRHFIKQGHHLPRDVADPALDQLFAVITSPRDKAIFSLMLRCGLRVGEVHRLSLVDLDLEPTQGRLARLLIHGKGGKQRVVYLSPQALAALKEWLIVRPDSPDPAVFLNRFGCRLSVSGIQDRLAHYCREANLRLTCHQLRHTFGRHLTEAQVPITTIQQLLGHSQLKTTQGYTYLSNRQAQTEYDNAMTTINTWLTNGGGQ